MLYEGVVRYEKSLQTYHYIIGLLALWIERVAGLTNKGGHSMRPPFGKNPNK